MKLRARHFRSQFADGDTQPRQSQADADLETNGARRRIIVQNLLNSVPEAQPNRLGRRRLNEERIAKHVHAGPRWTNVTESTHRRRVAWLPCRIKSPSFRAARLVVEAFPASAANVHARTLPDLVRAMHLIHLRLIKPCTHKHRVDVCRRHHQTTRQRFVLRRQRVIANAFRAHCRPQQLRVVIVLWVFSQRVSQLQQDAVAVVWRRRPVSSDAPIRPLVFSRQNRHGKTRVFKNFDLQKSFGLVTNRSGDETSR